MQEVKHTPWRVENSIKLECWAVYDSRGKCIFTSDSEANARLIAAAPDLLNGCNALLGLIQMVFARPDMPSEIAELLATSHRVAEANAAITKALSKDGQHD